MRNELNTYLALMSTSKEEKGSTKNDGFGFRSFFFFPIY